MSRCCCSRCAGRFRRGYESASQALTSPLIVDTQVLDRSVDSDGDGAADHVIHALNTVITGGTAATKSSAAASGPRTSVGGLGSPGAASAADGGPPGDASPPPRPHTIQGTRPSSPVRRGLGGGKVIARTATRSTVFSPESLAATADASRVLSKRASFVMMGGPGPKQQAVVVAAKPADAAPAATGGATATRTATRSVAALVPPIGGLSMTQLREADDEEKDEDEDRYTDVSDDSAGGGGGGGRGSAGGSFRRASAGPRSMASLRPSASAPSLHSISSVTGVSAAAASAAARPASAEADGVVSGEEDAAPHRAADPLLPVRIALEYGLLPLLIAMIRSCQVRGRVS